MTRKRTPQASGLLRDAQLTDAQAALVDMLGNAYRNDVAVKVDARTVWDPAGDRATASRTVSRGVVQKGLARYSEPGNRYLLLTDRGKALVLT